jgi:hypothetical protein
MSGESDMFSFAAGAFVGEIVHTTKLAAEAIALVGAGVGNFTHAAEGVAQVAQQVGGTLKQATQQV